MKQLHVPPKIKSLIGDKPFTIDDVGMSGNQVLILEKLGIEPDWEKIKYYLLLDELF